MLLEREEFYDYPPSILEKLIHGKQPLVQAPFRAAEGGVLENIFRSYHLAGHALQQSIKGKVC
jgi:hypothetical protein